jgi:iron complex outermembrane recepter protein
MKVTSKLIKAAMLSSISIVSLSFSTAVHAQAAPVAPVTEEKEEYSDTDIIVTATKREQTLQETPVAVTVTSAADIQKAQVRDLSDLQTLAPTLRVTQLQSSANTNFVIRGFGNGANNAGIEPSVGVFIDGVYRSRSASAIGDLPNLQRVEVLRGPQSTLFGKNASAGVISIITAAPKFEFGGSTEFSYGNFNAIIAKADITGPISDNIAFSLAGNFNKRDGYATDLGLNSKVNERNRYGGRGQLLIQPSEDFTIRMIGDYDRINEECCVAANIVSNPTLNPLLNFLAGGPAIDADNPFSYNVYTNLASVNVIDNYGGSVQMDYDLGSLSLTSISSYRGVDSFSNQDSDFTAADLLQRNSNDTGIRTFTQEFRVASDFEGPVNFLLGGYYFNEKINVNNELQYGSDFRGYVNALVQGASGGALNTALLETTFGALDGNPALYTNRFGAQGQGNPSEKFSLKDNSLSIFGTVDFEVTDRLTVTGGFNYTQDRKKFAANIVATDVFSAINLDAPQYAPFRRTLLLQGGIAQQVGAALGLGRSATAAEVGAFAAGATTAPIFAQINTGVTAFANANQNNPAANPLGGLRALQFQPPFVNLPNAVEDGRTSDNNLSYTARVAFEATDSINLYASYATGFKASSINLSRDSRPFASDAAALTAAGLNVSNLRFGSRFADPEKARVIEVGIKGKWDQVAFNLTAFKQSIKGFQSNIFTGTGFALANAGKQSTFGIEFDGKVKPTDALTLSVAMVYLDPKFDSYPAASGITPAGNTVTVDLSGTVPSAIPPLSMTLGADYDVDLGNENGLNLRVDYHYEAPSNLFDDNPANPNAVNFTRTVNALNASTTLTLANGLQLGFWGRNLTKAKYITTAFPSVAQNGSFSGYPSQPRTYGATVRYKF